MDVVADFEQLLKHFGTNVFASALPYQAMKLNNSNHVTPT
jgi:hypothetical protein